MGDFSGKKKIFKESLLGYPEKNQTGSRTFFFENPCGICQSFTFNFTPGNTRQNKAPPLEVAPNCVRSLGNSKAKNPWKFFINFSWSLLLGNSTLYLINPWKFHMLAISLPTPGNSIILTPLPPLFFSLE